ncbi:hypothetical protein RJ641_024937 [Dillenia turbinata]|uniref:Uncharacterized protein n=1 Tax=Dillenia turbinata TaxID=194707 RepID=A0AAN8W0M5_9MAGN
MASHLFRRVLRNPNNSSRVFFSLDRSFSSDSNLIRETLFPGNGIGPEIAQSVKQEVLKFMEQA